MVSANLAVPIFFIIAVKPCRDLATRVQGAIGDGCQASVEECRRKAADSDPDAPEMAVCGISFISLQELSATVGVSIQVYSRKIGICN